VLSDLRNTSLLWDIKNLEHEGAKIFSKIRDRLFQQLHSLTAQKIRILNMQLVLMFV